MGDDRPGHAAVDEDVLTVDVAGPVGGEEQDDVGDVGRRAEPAERHLRLTGFPGRRVGVDRLGHPGVDQARRHGVDADAEAAPLQGHLGGQQSDRGLRRSVGAGVRTGGDAVHRRHVDDRPGTSGLDPSAGSGPSDDERADEVDVDDGAEVVDVEIDERTEANDAGVVDDDVGRAELVEHGVDRRLVGDRGVEGLDRVIGGGGDVDDPDAIPGGVGRGGDRRPEPAGSPGDEHRSVR